MKIIKKGFTLIELIVVIAIIAVLALILIPAVTGFIDDADDSKNLANAKTCYTESLIMWQDNLASNPIQNNLDSNCVINGTIDAVDYDGTILPVSATYESSTYSTN